jgi:GT2 family glycosyltransferase
LPAVASRVGLVIVTYNAADFIERCLSAVAAQSRPPDRVIVIDNASRDSTVDVARKGAAAASLDVEIVALDENEGFARANNRGVAELTDCELVALLNPDAFPEPGWLAALIDAAGGHPEAGSFASRLMRDGAPGVLDGAGDVCHVSGLVWRHGHGRPLSEVPEALTERPVFSACAAAALYRRQDWIDAGGLEERFFCYVEDVDLGFRLQLGGRGCRYVPDAVALHVGSATSGVGSAFSVYHGHRNLEWLFVRNMPSPLLWRYLPLHAAASAMALAWFTLRGRGGSIVRAKWHALLGMTRAVDERRAVQASRVLATDHLRLLLDRSSLVARFKARAD